MVDFIKDGVEFNSDAEMAAFAVSVGVVMPEHLKWRLGDKDHPHSRRRPVREREREGRKEKPGKRKHGG